MSPSRCPKCRGGVFSCRCNPPDIQIFIDELNDRPRRAALRDAKEEERLANRAWRDYKDNLPDWDCYKNEELRLAFEAARAKVDELEKP